MALASPLMSQSKNFNSNLSLRRFPMWILQCTMTRVGTTPAVAVRPASRGLARPTCSQVNNAPNKLHVVGPKCLQPPHPAPCHSDPQTKSAHCSFWTSLRASRLSQWPCRLVRSCDHRSPIGPRQWAPHCPKLLEIAQNDPTFADCTAATPRWDTPPGRGGIEPSRFVVR